jgi:hypothetical protein
MFVTLSNRVIGHKDTGLQVAYEPTSIDSHTIAAYYR